MISLKALGGSFTTEQRVICWGKLHHRGPRRLIKTELVTYIAVCGEGVMRVETESFSTTDSVIAGGCWGGRESGLGSETDGTGHDLRIFLANITQTAAEKFPWWFFIYFFNQGQ